MPWLILFVIDALISLVTLVVFGLFGGLTMLIALNGFSESRGGAILLAYGLLVVIGNAVVASLANYLVVRLWFAEAGPAGWAFLVPALTTTFVLLVAGPPVSVLLIKLLFGS